MVLAVKDKAMKNFKRNMGMTTKKLKFKKNLPPIKENLIFLLINNQICRINRIMLEILNSLTLNNP